MTDGFTWRDIGDEDAAREQHDADATIIPRTLEEVSSLIETLGPSMSPMALGSTIEMIIEGLAKLGVDDVVAEPFLQVIRNRSRSPIRDLRKLLAKKRPEPTPVAVPLGVIEAMLVCYVYVKQLGAFWDRKARTVVKVHSVREAYWHEMPDNPFSETPGEKIDPYELLIKGNAMLGAPKACDRADLFMFKPGADEFFADERGCRALNIWVKSELLSIEGNVQPFLDHVYLVLNGNEAMVRHQLDFLAHLVQRPHVKIKSTILIIGLEGCGKTVIAEMMVAILGKDNVAFIDAADLENPFNSFMDGKILVVVNELIALSKPARNKLKAYITDSKMTINRKNVATYDYDNFANFLMYSNYEDGAIIAEGDRRFGVEISKLSPRGSDYFKKLWGWYENGGKSHLLHYLQHRPLDGFDAFAPPPVTASKLQVIENSRDAIVAYMRDALAAGEAPFIHDLVTVNHIIDWFMEKRRLKVTHKQVSIFLRGIGAEWLGQRPIRGARPGVWAMRNGAEWAQVGNDGFNEGWRDIEEPPIPDHIRDQLLGRRRRSVISQGSRTLQRTLQKLGPRVQALQGCRFAGFVLMFSRASRMFAGPQNMRFPTKNMFRAVNPATLQGHRVPRARSHGRGRLNARPIMRTRTPTPRLGRTATEVAGMGRHAQGIAIGGHSRSRPPVFTRTVRIVRLGAHNTGEANEDREFGIANQVRGSRSR